MSFDYFSLRLDINIAIQQQQRLHAMLLFHFVDEHTTHKILYREFHQFALYHFAKDEDADVEEQRMQKQTHRTEKKEENRRERLRSDFDVCASRHRTITTFAQVSEKRRQPTCNFKVEAANACEWIESLFRLPAGIFLISLSSRVVVGVRNQHTTVQHNDDDDYANRWCSNIFIQQKKKETRRHGRRREWKNPQTN